MGKIGAWYINDWKNTGIVADQSIDLAGYGASVAFGDHIYLAPYKISVPSPFAKINVFTKKITIIENTKSGYQYYGKGFVVGSKIIFIPYHGELAIIDTANDSFRFMAAGACKSTAHELHPDTGLIFYCPGIGSGAGSDFGWFDPVAETLNNVRNVRVNTSYGLVAPPGDVIYYGGLLHTAGTVFETYTISTGTFAQVAVNGFDSRIRGSAARTAKGTYICTAANQFVEIDLATMTGNYLGAAADTLGTPIIAHTGEVFFPPLPQVNSIDPATGTITTHGTAGGGGATVCQGADNNIYAICQTAPNKLFLITGV